VAAIESTESDVGRHRRSISRHAKNWSKIQRTFWSEITKSSAFIAVCLL
jgi:hypothetical protein